MDVNNTYELEHGSEGEGFLPEPGHPDHSQGFAMTEAVQILTQDVLVVCILLGLTGLVGVLGNVLMLRALFLYKHLRIDFYILLGSVSVADILCLLIAVPKYIIDLTEAEGPVTDSWCKGSRYLETGASFVASYHLVVLAVLRAILLTSRGRDPTTPLKTLLCVVAIWVIALLAAIPFLITKAEKDGLCHYTFQTDADIGKDIYLTHAFSCFVPLAMILGIYVLAHCMGKRYFEDSYSYREKQISRLVTTIVIVFLVCQLPYRILDIHLHYQEIKPEQDPEKLESLYIARNYLLCFMMADKAARPVIYSKLAPDRLAEAFDEVINCTFCHRVYTRGRNTTNMAAPPGHNGRLPSTASNAPLTGYSDEIKSEPEIIPL